MLWLDRIYLVGFFFILCLFLFGIMAFSEVRRIKRGFLVVLRMYTILLLIVHRPISTLHGADSADDEIQKK